MNEFSPLKEKIAEAKRRLPLPPLMSREGLGEHAKKEAHCPFHSDEHKSFSVFQGNNGAWFWKCHAACGEGDEISFLRKLKGLSQTRAVSLYLELAGFPLGRAPKSHEFPQFPRSPECLGSPVYPVSNGQALEEELKGLAGRNACSERNTDRERRWQLLRDLRAVEERIARRLSNGELMQVFNEWYRLSHPFLDRGKTRDDYLAAFLAELGKVRVPTGEKETIKKALEYVSTLSVSALPLIPGVKGAAESWRRVAALHRELSRRCASKTYFLSCRDAAKAFPGLSYQLACDINRALERLGVIKIVRIGDRRLNGKASTFRYLLAQTKNGGPQAENGRHASKDREEQNAGDWDTW
jgi:hypothetical protein